jgi:hypothetical protein
MKSLYVIGIKLLIHYKAQQVRLYGESVAVYFVNHSEQRDTLCGQNAEFVPHKKQITSLLQSPTG